MTMTSITRSTTFCSMIALAMTVVIARVEAQQPPSAAQSQGDLPMHTGTGLALGSPSSIVRMSDGVCHHPADSLATRTSNVFLTLEPRDMPYPMQTLVLNYIAQDIAAPVTRSVREADGRLRLLPADDLYPPGILHSRATFTLHRDGSLTDVDVSNVVHDGFRGLLRASFDSIQARGGVGGFDSRGLPEVIPMMLRLETVIGTSRGAKRGAAPLFTLEEPLERVATMRPGNKPPPYPREARSLGAEGVVLLTFVVDREGKVREETIRSLPPDPPVPPDLRDIFGAFERAAMRAAREYRYNPASFDGCAVQMWVTQPFAFTFGR